MAEDTACIYIYVCMKLLQWHSRLEKKKSETRMTASIPKVKQDPNTQKDQKNAIY